MDCARRYRSNAVIDPAWIAKNCVTGRTTPNRKGDFFARCLAPAVAGLSQTVRISAHSCCFGLCKLGIVDGSGFPDRIDGTCRSDIPARSRIAVPVATMLGRSGRRCEECGSNALVRRRWVATAAVSAAQSACAADPKARGLMLINFLLIVF